ncbi:MAG: hypothetical protein AAFZ49_04675 [Cyanobacteria bacterium J06659_2]
MEVFGGVLLIIMGGYVGYALCLIPMGKLLAYRQCRTLSSAPNALIYLAGTTTNQPPLVSPLGKTACIQWKIQVLETTGSGQRKTTIKRLEIRSDQPYFISDGTHLVKVFLPQSLGDPLLRIGRLMLGLPRLGLGEIFGKGELSYRAHQNLCQPFEDGRVTALLASHGISLKGMLGLARNLSVRAYIFTPGQPIYIWGKLIRHRQAIHLMAKIVSFRSRLTLILASLGLGLFGLLVALLGAKLIYEFGLR